MVLVTKILNTKNRAGGRMISSHLCLLMLSCGRDIQEEESFSVRNKSRAVERSGLKYVVLVLISIQEMYETVSRIL